MSWPGPSPLGGWLLGVSELWLGPIYVVTVATAAGLLFALTRLGHSSRRLLLTVGALDAAIALPAVALLSVAIRGGHPTRQVSEGGAWELWLWLREPLTALTHAVVALTVTVTVVSVSRDLHAARASGRRGAGRGLELATLLATTWYAVLTRELVVLAAPTA